MALTKNHNEENQLKFFQVKTLLQCSSPLVLDIY